MLRLARWKTRLDHIRNGYIIKKAHIKAVETFMENRRLKGAWPLLDDVAEVDWEGDEEKPGRKT